MPTEYESTMQTTLRSDADTFLDQWGQDIVRRICGSVDNTDTIRAIVDHDDEMASGLDGGGLDPSSQSGSRVSRSMLLEVKATCLLTNKDIVDFDDELWSPTRIVARDHGMITWSCSTISGGTSKRARIRP